MITPSEVENSTRKSLFSQKVEEKLKKFKDLGAQIPVLLVQASKESLDVSMLVTSQPCGM